MNRMFSWMLGLGLGAGAMYFLDPDRGRTRRALVRDQANHWVSQSDEAINKTARDVQNRFQGMMSRVSKTMNENPMISETAEAGVRGRGEGEATANWNPTARLVAGLGGGLLWLVGVNRKGLMGTAMSMAGLGLAVRGVTNTPIENLVGLGGRERGIDIHKTINIQAPVDQVYQYWANFENFPKFMSHLESVTVQGEGHSHWVAKGPAGVPVEWDAVETNNVPDERISWESVPGSQVMTRGTVRFTSDMQGGTQINVHMSYSPPGGVLGHAVAQIMGEDPKSAMDDDLNRLKTLIETGKTSKGDTRVSQEDVNP